MSEDQETRIQAILGWLEQGRITTDQAAARIVRMSFDAAPEREPYATQLADATGDHHASEPGSFFAVSHAFAEGRITREQYAALAEAAAKATRPVSGA